MCNIWIKNGMTQFLNIFQVKNIGRYMYAYHKTINCQGFDMCDIWIKNGMTQFLNIFQVENIGTYMYA